MGLHSTRARKLRQEPRLFWAQKFSLCCWGHGGSSCEKWLSVELLLWLLLPCSILNLIWLKKKIQSSLPTDEASWMKGGGKPIADEACQGCCLSWSQIKWNWAIFFVANKQLAIMCNKQWCSGPSLPKWHGCCTFPAFGVQGCLSHWVPNPCSPGFFMCFLLKGKK